MSKVTTPHVSESLDLSTPSSRKIFQRPNMFRRAIILVNATFGLSMMQQWEVALVSSLMALAIGVILFSIVCYLPANLKLATKRAIYYWNGSLDSAMAAGLSARDL